MYKRLSMVMFPFVTLALIGAAVWGYLEHQEKNTILIKAENQYQRAFHDLSYHVDKLHTQLGNTLAVNSTSQDSYRKGLIHVWRLTSEAQNDISQLPLSLLPFNKTEEFLANMANFSYRTAVRDLTKQPMSDNEMKTLNELYAHSQEITNHLRNVQEQVMANNLRWMDVEVALASQKEPYDNMIIDGFQTVDKEVSAYAQIDWGPGNLDIFHKRDMQALSGKEVTVEEVKQKAQSFLGIQDTANLQVVENGKDGAEYQSFSVTIPGNDKGEGDVQMDYTKKGGELIYFMKQRAVPEAKVDVRQARDIANEFLDQHGYKEMSAVSYDQYQNIANLIFVKRQNDVTIYPEKVSVMVALDNGEVTGLQTTDFLVSQKDRKIGTPQLSTEEARKTLNPKMEVNRQSLAIIRNDQDQEVLCHEFVGKINSSLYKVFVNSETGTEEKIENIRPDQLQAMQ